MNYLFLVSMISKVSQRSSYLKLEILKCVKIEIELGYDPLKFTFGPNSLSLNGLKIELDREMRNLTGLISIIL